MQPDALGDLLVKVKIVANELLDTDIEMVSLVRHGANRCPFKVLKSDDESPVSKLGDKLQSFFSIAKGEFSVTAYFIRKDAADSLLPILKAEGVDTSNVSESEGVTVVTLSNASARGFIQLTDALAIAVDQPIKEFSDESIVKAYAEGVGLSGFAPSVNLAVSGLAESVWSLLNSNEVLGEREDRIAKVDTMLASFRKYITSLARMLPAQVFKVEAAVRAVQTEDADMPKGKLDEAVVGDLDGLPTEPVTKTDAEAPVTPSVVTKTAEEVKVEPTAAAEKPPVTEDKPDALASILKALDAINSKVDGLAKSIEDQRSVTDTLAAQVAEATEVLEKAEDSRRSTTVVRMGADMDLALSSLGGSDSRTPRKTIGKADEEKWGNLFSDLDTFRPSR